MTPDAGAATLAPGTASLRISVIVPSYNSGPFLREALTSALDQDPPPYEVLLQDGGSTDDTLDILRSFGERVAWVSQPDGGQADAINKALARASGDVVLLLNADDMILPGTVEAATAAFQQDHDLAFAYGDFDMIDHAGVVLRRYRSSDYSWDRIYARGCYIFVGSVFLRRQLLIEIGGFDASLRACMDLDLLLRLGTVGRSRHLGRTIAQYRVHDDAKSSTMRLVFFREAFRVRKRHAGRSPRLWGLIARETVRAGIVSALTPLRHSSRWPRNGRGKTL